MSLDQQHAEVRRRDINFQMQSDIPVHWLNRECHRTRFYDAMSIMFPEGERAFIDSVAHYRSRIPADSPLGRDVAGFIGQEALHTREHRRYNARLEAAGAPVARLEKIVADQRKFANRHLSPRVRLAITICLEHYTAMFADQLLSHPKALSGAESRMHKLWRWHAVEEAEHKSVAFDVFKVAVPNPLLRYGSRCLSMLLVSTIFSAMIWYFTYQLVKSDGRLSDWRGWGRLLREQFVSPGFLLRLIPQWLSWFVPGFHPGWHDNRALVKAASKEYDDWVHAQSSSGKTGGA
ncbi:metal-dependent hydrolase [Comamonas composti]|uniref:metal-dependent hydrolase n=1 Tax=Comamonas composti TaxID=408558 RepID=UPI00040DDDFE|nr:metal-dependent hydrolase [Comamonas composti]